MFMGSNTMKKIISNLNEQIEFIKKKDTQNYPIQT